MKTFVLKVLSIAFIIFGLLAVLVLASDYMISQNEDTLLNLRDDISVVFAGNSAVECAVDDKIVGGSVNIAQSGEAYLYTYSKLKALLETNKQVQTVFVGYSYADLLFEKEESWLFSDEFVTEKIQYYNYLLDFQEKKLFLSRDPGSYFNGVMKSIYNNIITVITSTAQPKGPGQLVNFGGYKYLVRDKLGADPGADLYQQEPVRKSVLQEKYLQMISRLCQQYGVELILLTTPKYRIYNENLDNEIHKLWIDTRNTMPSDSLLDLSAWPLPDSCYGDFSHLNYRGARLFSNYINHLINNIE